MTDFVPRIVEPLLEQLLRSTPVVVLEGGRAVGKSTLCDRLIDRLHWQPRVDLSDRAVLATLRLDPRRFLGAQRTPCVIDEARLEPELPLWVKRHVDQRRQSGQFLLTGSARLGRHQLGGSDPLAALQAATVRNHLEQLESAFLLARVEAERPTEARVVSAHPRVFAADTGLATWAARAWVGQPTAAVRGSLTETAVAHDLSAAADANAQRVTVRHWRDERNKREVDLLLVHPDGRYVPVEVKASTTVGPADTAGLRAFAEIAGSRCVRCLLVYESPTIVDLTPPGDHVEVLAVPHGLL